MPKPSLELKGSSFTLSVLHINNQDLDAVAAELDHKLAQAPQFFIGAPLVVNLSGLDGEEVDVAALKQLLTSRQLVIVGVTGASAALNQQAKDQGLASIKAGKQSPVTPPQVRNTKIVKQNIRSGQQVYAKDGDLVIFGAVGNGAEVIADGSIHIYGALRGKAMAGAGGDRHAVIIAQSMEAELVSIAGQYWLAENLQQHCPGKSGCIRLEGESLIVESLPL
ncbi:MULTISPECIES: septum site-determining protein MinC [Shewanella]|uniref:Probable septum site-determining protein MinC n=1 Tax=Shewanella salipaludis TaxID=2723052 RepID=A0A972FQ82_9GAMM|nr:MULTISPECIES: septum site-determining protein MinC [Shewanella]MCE9684676.1 septum site-determining protein MinC [Shewanella sp. AS16]NMH64135.1 septum site-determining protein MinC [Shewanella salipaludis]